MFSVDNFYYFFKTKYGWKKHQVLTWLPTEHGNKNLAEWIRWENISDCIDSNGVWDHARHDIYGSVILHDQEPFYLDVLDIYRIKNSDDLKDSFSHIMGNREYFLRIWQTCSWPVFCHSEKNSDSIDWLNSIGIIDCHYFYHGLIARDWYRHWKHHPDLIPKTTWEKRFLLYIRDTEGKRQYRKKILEDLKMFSNYISYHWNEKNNISSEYSAKIVVEDAEKTGIHIVSETVFDDRKIHLTEKIFKPIVMCQPFIVYAGPGSLEYLRSYGFETFSEIWDESYDLEGNHDRRRRMIADLIENLCSLDDNKFCNVLKKCQKIVEHNRQHFYSDKFEVRLLKELDTNIISAYNQQKNLLKTDPGGSYFHMVDLLIKKGLNLNQVDNRSPRLQNTSTKIKDLLRSLKKSEIKRYESIISTYDWIKFIS
jgi:hypothetical protein